jgi:hypothetical protein
MGISKHSPADQQYKGYFLTSAALNTAYPIGQPGWYANVEATDTIWVWDVGTAAWKNSGTAALPAWGSITGTLSNQTDLQNALDAKLNKDGSVALTANWDAGSFKITAEQFESDIATGTAPLIVASTTKVSNLNADKLDDQEGSYYLDVGNMNAGLLVHERGGLEADVSAFNGFIKISGGATSAITDNSTNWNTAYTHI